MSDSKPAAPVEVLPDENIVLDGGYFEENRGKIIGGVAVVLAVAVGYLVWGQHKESVQNKAWTALAGATNEAGYLLVAEQHAGTAAAVQALTESGDAFLADEKWEAAAKAFGKLASEYPTAPVAANALMGQAVAQERMKQVDEAISTLQKLIGTYPTALVVPQARIALGNLYETKGMWADARQAYEALKSQNAQSAYVQEANTALARIQGK
jgi:tetratricopeptide (TPR) repeat protein